MHGESEKACVQGESEKACESEKARRFNPGREQSLPVCAFYYK
jgi:hypothetical protein